MHIEAISTTNDPVDSDAMKDLLSYLAQIVLCKTDDDAKRKHRILENYKTDYEKINKSVEVNKKRLDGLSSEYARQKTINRVLGLVQRLKKMGTLSKNSNQKLYRLLEKIESKDFASLRDLEEKLSSHLGEN